MTKRNPLLPIDFKGILGDIKSASSEEDFFSILYELESLSPHVGAAMECPYYFLMPPVLIPKADWPNSLVRYGIDNTSLTQMLSDGFMPLDREMLSKKVLCDLFEPFPPQERYFLVDVDYGQVLHTYYHQIGSKNLDVRMIDRYAKYVPMIKESQELILSIGTIRGQTAYKGKLEDKDRPAEVSVNSREELDELVNFLRQRISLNPNCELWFRGQTRDYLLSDYRREAMSGICPWRGVIDTSLVPSFYRRLHDRIEDMRNYCQACLELTYYSVFCKLNLGAPMYTVRGKGEEPVEKLSDAWEGYAPEFTAKTVVDGEVVETRDYHMGFYGLQNAFFLQHYGLPTSILDITSDLDIALFFAQNNISSSYCKKVDRKTDNPVLYLFILDKRTDRYFRGEKLYEQYRMLRPQRQKCGILAGASLITRNYYSRFIAMKVYLRKEVRYNRVTPEYIFPNSSEDAFLNELLEFERRNSFTWAKPFTYRE